MEKLYEEIFGQKPAKKGTAYELIVGAVLKFLNKDAKITHNVFFKSPYSNDEYQIDNLHETDEIVFVETKDYSEKDKKVGRPDVSKLEGTLCILKNNIDKGLLASATDFTKPAKQYIRDLIKANGIPIDLFIIRKSLPEDAKGTIRKICININVVTPNFQNATFNPAWDKESMQVLNKLGYKEGDSIKISISSFHNKQGAVLDTIWNLTSKLQLNTDLMLAQGEWKFDEQAYIYVNESLVPVESVIYKVPFVTHTKKMEINAGKPIILVSSIDGEFHKIISFEDLKKISITENSTYNIKH